MRKMLICGVLIGCVMLTACAARQDPTPTLMPPLPTDGPTPTPTSLAVVLTPVVVTGEARATATVTAAPTQAPDVVYNPTVTGPVAPEDVVFIRGVGGEALSTDTKTVEVWAIGRDASNARLVTTYNPQQPLFTLESSPDRRFVVASDTPGAVLIDFVQGTKTVLFELPAASGWIGQFAWTPDSKSVYYAVHDTAGGAVTIYGQTVDPLGAPQPLQGSMTLSGVALYPHRVMPDGRVLMYAASTETYHDAALVDPASGAVVPLDTSAYGTLVVLDVRDDGMVLFQAMPTIEAPNPPIYMSAIDAAGKFAGAFQATDAGYGWAQFLPNGGFAALSAVDPLVSQLVIFPEPQNQGIVQPTLTEFPGDPDSEVGFGVLDAATLLVRRNNPPELWIYPLDGSPAYELVDFSLMGE